MCSSDLPWCMAELGIALDRGRLLIPLRLGKPEVVPLLLQDGQAIQPDPLAFDASASDATTTTNAAAAAAATTSATATTATSCDDARLGLQRRLAEAISWRDKLPWQELDHGRAGQRPFHRSPFPGLNADDASHAPLFFCRDQQIHELSDRVRRKCSAGSGLLLLLGSSGCGKSSLLGAGLVPLLRQGERSGEPCSPITPSPCTVPASGWMSSWRHCGCGPIRSPDEQQSSAASDSTLMVHSNSLSARAAKVSPLCSEELCC